MFECLKDKSLKIFIDGDYKDINDIHNVTPLKNKPDFPLDLHYKTKLKIPEAALVKLQMNSIGYLSVDSEQARLFTVTLPHSK
jgi:hypothetical protein